MAAHDGLFSITKFSKLSRTNRTALIFYDNVGLLSPMARGNNNYRYYSSKQLAVVNLIKTLQKLGLSLDDIKLLIDNRTPESISELLNRQIVEIETKIDELVSAKKLLFTLRKIIISAININEESLSIQYLPAESIVLGSLNDYSRGKNSYDALISFYLSLKDSYPNIDLNYPVWAKFSKERILKRDWFRPDRYYLYYPEGHDKRPAAFYAIGYTRGGYGQSDSLYNRLLNYIKENNFEICGDSYEEYPLNEICVSNSDAYLMRVMITVRERDAK